MNKIIVLTAILCASFSFSACGSASQDSENVKLANTEVTSAVETGSVEVEEEVSSLPDKENFGKVPDEALDSFNYMIEASKELYSETGSKRLYGYLGTEQISNKSCYLFAIYDEQDNVHTEIATLGVEPNSKKMYAYNNETMKFELLDIPTESGSDSEAQWADVVTDSFEEYLSADSETSDDVSITTVTAETPVEGITNVSSN